MIELINISKKFNINLKKNQSALEKALSLINIKRCRQEFWALKDICLNAGPGANLAIIGKNGSGKSTLLRTIAGIYKPDKGTLRTNGEVVYLSGFGQWLRPKLTMKDNIYLAGSIMGLSQLNIKKRFQEIVDFSGLEEYIDVKLYKFSSGMTSRLAYSAGIFCLHHKNPDILLLDEALGSSTDINFRDKAIKKMEDFFNKKTTVILATHNLAAVKQYCSQALWIDNGKIVMRGDPEQVIISYQKS